MVDTEQWSAYVREYDALKCGSIDGTDTEPHDRAIVRAQTANYRPPQHLTNNHENTIFIARLNRDTNEETLRHHFKRFGNIKQLDIIRNIVTGFSQGYAFIEYDLNSDAREARKEGHQMVIDGREIIVEKELEHTLPDWVPRRFGGGFGGKKESGQLRFGCKERPFRKPISLATNEKFNMTNLTDQSYENNRFVSERKQDRVRFRDRRRGGEYSQRSHGSRVRSRSRERSRSRDRKRSRSRDRERRRSKERSRRYRSRSKERSRRRSRSRDRSRKDYDYNY